MRAQYVNESILKPKSKDDILNNLKKIGFNNPIEAFRRSLKYNIPEALEYSIDLINENISRDLLLPIDMYIRDATEEVREIIKEKIIKKRSGIIDDRSKLYICIIDNFYEPIEELLFRNNSISLDVLLHANKEMKKYIADLLKGHMDDFFLLHFLKATFILNDTDLLEYSLNKLEKTYGKFLSSIFSNVGTYVFNYLDEKNMKILKDFLKKHNIL